MSRGCHLGPPACLRSIVTACLGASTRFAVAASPFDAIGAGLRFGITCAERALRYHSGEWSATRPLKLHCA